MRRFTILLVSLSVLWFDSSTASAQPAAAKGSLDALVDWNNPWSLTSDQFKEIAGTLTKRKSDRAYSTRLQPDGRVFYSIGMPRAGVPGGTKMSLFNGVVQVDAITAAFVSDKLASLAFTLGEIAGVGARKASKNELEKIKSELSKATGDQAPQPYDGDSVKGQPPPVGQRWTHRDYKVQLIEIYSYPLSGAATGTGVFTLVISRLGTK